MSVLLVVNTPPYGSEGPYNAFRLAEALAVRLETIHDLAAAVVRSDNVISF